jgi:hypothetical protein
MGKTKLEEYNPVIIPASLFIFSIVTAIVYLPENCFFFESQPGPFNCDTIPNDCCKFGIDFYISHAILFGGIGLTLGTAFYFFRQDSVNETDKQTKLFD